MENDKIKLLAKDCTRIGNLFYFIASELNLIFSLDIDKKQLQLIDSIPSNVSVEKEYVGSICAYKNELYISPLKTNSIWVFNLETQRWTELLRKRMPYMGSGSMLQIFVYNEFVYMMGGRYPAIIKINPETKEMEYIEEPFKEKGMNPKDAYFRAQHVVKDDVLYVPCCIDNSVLKFNLETEMYEWCVVGNKENRFSGIAYDGECFWLAPRLNSSVVKWDGRSGIKEFSLLDGYVQPKNYFLGCMFDGKDILLCNMLDDNSLKITGRKEDIIKMQCQYSMAKQIEDVMVCQNKAGIFSVCKNGLQLAEMELKIDMQVVVDFYKKRDSSMCSADQIYSEGDLFTLSNFLKLLTGEWSEVEVCKNSHIRCGKKGKRVISTTGSVSLYD